MYEYLNNFGVDISRFSLIIEIVTNRDESFSAVSARGQFDNEDDAIKAYEDVVDTSDNYAKMSVKLYDIDKDAVIRSYDSETDRA